MNVYDFDGTIYDGDSSIDFYLFALKMCPTLIRFIPKQMLGFALYAVKKISKTKLKEYFFCFLKGIDSEAAADRFWNINKYKIKQWYLEGQKPDDVIISASPEFLLSPICTHMGIKNLIASKVDSSNGKFESSNCHGLEKVTRYKYEYGNLPINCFYSDSLSDYPLAYMAENAFLVKGDNIEKWNLSK